MPNFICKAKNTINDFEISLYEINLDNNSDLNKLENFIKNKINNMKVHNKENHYSNYLKIPNISTEFAEKIVQRIQEITSPKNNSITWFDVRRSRVTEFMAQLLLEKHFNCLFYDEADKRINVDPVNLDKHTPGIDVTGIYKDNSGFKFVACEVKASKDPKVPCSSANSLLNDIKNGYENKDDRLSKEILQYIQGLCKISDDKLIEDIIEFLTMLISKSSAKKVFLDNIIFFPFMIRNNPEIIGNHSLNDFENFKKENFKNINLKGVIWAFNRDIDSFCNTIYDEVLKNGT